MFRAAGNGEDRFLSESLSHFPSPVSESCYPGFSALIRALHGRGDKDVRIVNSYKDSTEALTFTQREPAKRFGNAIVLVERYFTRPRRAEVQVFADEHEDTVSP